MNSKEQQIKAARYLAKVNPKKYYLKYYLGILTLWQKSGGLLDHLIATF